MSESEVSLNIRRRKNYVELTKEDVTEICTLLMINKDGDYDSILEKFGHKISRGGLKSIELELIHRDLGDRRKVRPSQLKIGWIDEFRKKAGFEPTPYQRKRYPRNYSKGENSPVEVEEGRDGFDMNDLIDLIQEKKDFDELVSDFNDKIDRAIEEAPEQLLEILEGLRICS